MPIKGWKRKELNYIDIQVLIMLYYGFDNPRIATLMGRSIYTITNRLQHIFRILEVENRTRAVTKALELGVIDLQETIGE